MDPAEWIKWAEVEASASPVIRRHRYLFDDAVGSALVKLAARPPENVGIARTICRTAIVDFLRSNFGRRDSSARRNRLSEITFEEIDHGVMQDEEFPDMVQAVSELPARLRFVVSALAAGYGMREIGEMLGITESRASQLLAQARLRIRNDWT